MAFSRTCQQTESLRQHLQSLLGLCVDLKINQNRKTVISVLEKRPDLVKVSIHRIFLEAPREILEATARFLGTSQSKPCKLLHFYIHEKMKEHREATICLRSSLSTKGKCFDLEQEWNAINEEYFGSALNVYVSWFGHSNVRYRGSATVGQYDSTQNLIRVHRLLDDESVPRFYLRFVLYHEALHKLYPPYLDDRGVLQIHHSEFKFHEKSFKEYHKALKWEKGAKIGWFAA
jgi:hypothetical protein